MKFLKKNLLKINGKVLIVAGAALMGLMGLGSALAGEYITMSSMADSINSTSTALSTIISDTSLVTGVGFTMCSFFKFHQHKLNPTQVPLSQGCTLLLIGAGLCFLPLLLPSAANAVFSATDGQINKIGGSVMNTLIGSGGG